MQAKLVKGCSSTWCPQRRRSNVLARAMAASFVAWVTGGGSWGAELLEVVGRVYNWRMEHWVITIELAM